MIRLFRNKRGFTSIELILVISFLGMIKVPVTPNIGKVLNSGCITQSSTETSHLDAIKLFNTDKQYRETVSKRTNCMITRLQKTQLISKKQGTKLLALLHRQVEEPKLGKTEKISYVSY